MIMLIAICGHSISGYVPMSVTDQYAASNVSVPLFLEAVSVTDETEIGMDAIRLNGQEFRVEVAAVASGKPVVAYRRFEHHLMWCSDGITPLMNAAYQSMLEAGQPVMQTGTDPAQSERRGIGRQRLTSA